MKEPVMVDIIPRIERGQGQPNEGRAQMVAAKSFPEQPAPHDVVIAVIVAAANRPAGKLQPPEDQSDSECRGNQCKVAMRSLGSKSARKLSHRFHSLSSFLVGHASASQLLDQLEKADWIDWFGDMSIKPGVERTFPIIVHRKPGYRDHGNRRIV